MDTTDILSKAWEVTDEIKMTPEYREFREAEKAIMTVPECQLLVASFERANLAFSSTYVYGKSHPDFAKTKEALVNARAILFQRPEYIHYLETKQRLDNLLKTVTDAINGLISPLDLNRTHTCKKGTPHGKT